MEIIIWAAAILIAPILIIWFVSQCIGRFNEYLNRRKTLRRMNDLGNMYYDYNHNIWVTKIDPVQLASKEIDC